jgi:hypothetical protein
MVLAARTVLDTWYAFCQARMHTIGRHGLHIQSQAVDGMPVPSSCLLASIKADCARMGLSTRLAACLQDCVRLGAVNTHLEFMGREIMTWCDLHEPWHALVGLSSPPGSSQQRQLFGLMCSLLKTVQMQAATAPAVQNRIK